MLGKDKKKKSNGKNHTADTYQGQIRLKIESAGNHIEISRFCDTIKKIRNLSIISYNWSEKEGLNIFISLKDPTPLDDTLLQIPQVERISREKKSLTVVFNTDLLESSTRALEVTNQGALAS